jgi:hypothetical protein
MPLRRSHCAITNGRRSNFVAPFVPHKYGRLMAINERSREISRASRVNDYRNRSEFADRRCARRARGATSRIPASSPRVPSRTRAAITDPYRSPAIAIAQGARPTLNPPRVVVVHDKSHRPRDRSPRAEFNRSIMIDYLIKTRPSRCQPIAL